MKRDYLADIGFHPMLSSFGFYIGLDRSAPSIHAQQPSFALVDTFVERIRVMDS